MRQVRRAQLCICFLNLSGAFASVSRPLLWQALQRLGIHGDMLAAVQSLYATATVAVTVQSQGRKVSPPFRDGRQAGLPQDRLLCNAHLLYWSIRLRHMLSRLAERWPSQMLALVGTALLRTAHQCGTFIKVCPPTRLLRCNIEEAEFVSSPMSSV